MARQQESGDAMSEAGPRGAGELGAEEGLATTSTAEREQTEAGAAELGGVGGIDPTTVEPADLGGRGMTG